MDPAEVLRAVNVQICANNREEMPVTVWFGILDTDTGKITAANAGHEYPAVMQGGGRFEIFKDQHGFVREAEQFDDLTMLCVEHRGGRTEAICYENNCKQGDRK